MQKLGRRAATVKADVSEPDDVAAMIEFVRERFGRLDILVSNAASGGFRQLMDATPRHFENAMNTNVRALLLLTQAAEPMLERSEGRAKVVAISSHGSHKALPAYGLIGASKAALESMVRHLALELGNHGVNVNAVLAGLVETDSTRGLPEFGEFFQAVNDRRMTSGRPLLPRDVADAVLYLVSPVERFGARSDARGRGGEGITG